jgi:hypothetical protein
VSAHRVAATFKLALAKERVAESSRPIPKLSS